MADVRGQISEMYATHLSLARSLGDKATMADYLAMCSSEQLSPLSDKQEATMIDANMTRQKPPTAPRRRRRSTQRYFASASAILTKRQPMVAPAFKS